MTTESEVKVESESEVEERLRMEFASMEVANAIGKAMEAAMEAVKVMAKYKIQITRALALADTPDTKELTDKIPSHGGAVSSELKADAEANSFAAMILLCGPVTPKLLKMYETADTICGVTQTLGTQPVGPASKKAVN
jgi:hypothetical protein